MPLIDVTTVPMFADDAGADAVAGVEIVRAMLIVLGIVIIAVMLVLSVRGKIARRQADLPSPREQIEQAKAGHGTHRESARHAARPGRASANAVDETRHLATLLDNKAERLEQLLTEAEEVIVRLEQAMGADVDRPNEGHGATLNDEDSSFRHRPSAPADPLTRSVYELADAGHDSVEIAQQLDEQVGKIDLILALRQ
jgi:hypothetical protein